MNNVSIPLIEETINIFRGLRVNTLVAMQKLYQLHESGEWKDKEGNWGSFVEEHLQISQSFASKLLTTYKHYVIEGGMEENQLSGVDHEKLYLAAKIEGTPEEKVAKAKTLSRAELRQEYQEDKPHAFEAKTICKVCGGSLENHAKDVREEEA